MTIDIETIERYVDQVLEVNGFCKGDKELLRELLHRLYTAASIFHLMTDEQRALIGRIQKELSVFFVTKIVLKERKRRGKKRNIPPTPPIKENKGQVKDEKTLSLAARREAFHQECLEYVGQFDTKLLSDFFNYWSEENVKKSKMRYEDERHWSTESRLKKWANNKYQSDNTAAALRLEKVKKGKAKAQESNKQQVAVERDDANEQLFRQIEENKKKAVSYDEYLAHRRAEALVNSE